MTLSPAASPDLQFAAAVASPDAIRAHFPALDRRVGEHPVAYFDGPGGTQVPGEVADAVVEYLLEHNANAGWNFPTSRETDEVLDGARHAMADLFGARPGEIVFGANMTTLTLRISRALGRRLGPGDRIVLTELDHHANVDPWKALAQVRGCEIRVVRMDPERGVLDMDNLESALDDRTRIVAVGAASNALGTITDVAAVAERARAVGATVFVDAVHYAPHRLVDVEALGADYLVASAYKFYGPHVGVLWAREDHLDALDVARVISTPEQGPRRIETGTQNFEGIAGARAAVDFLAGLAEGENRRSRLATIYQALHERHQDLIGGIWDGLGGIRGVRRYGPPPGSAPRTATICFSVEGVEASAAADALSERGVFLSHGDFYAPTLVERVAGPGARLLRAGCAAYTTGAEVERLLEGVEGVSRSAGRS